MNFHISLCVTEGHVTVNHQSSVASASPACPPRAPTSPHLHSGRYHNTRIDKAPELIKYHHIKQIHAARQFLLAASEGFSAVEVKLTTNFLLSSLQRFNFSFLSCRPLCLHLISTFILQHFLYFCQTRTKLRHQKCTVTSLLFFVFEPDDHRAQQQS